MKLSRVLKYWFLVLTTPIQKWMQKFGRDETKITAKIVNHLVSIIKPGDILLSHENQRLTSYFIKGYYKHAAIVTSKGTVMESVGDCWENGINIGGVREVDLTEWLYKKDFVAVIRTNLPLGIVLKAALNAFDYKGMQYDYTFKIKNTKIYCSELPFLCYFREWTPFLAELPEDTEILPQKYLELCGNGYLFLIIDTWAIQNEIESKDANLIDTV